MGRCNFMKKETIKIVGIVLIIAGLTILISGITQFTQFQGSAAGKISNVIGDIMGSVSKKKMIAIIQMITGAITALCGIVVMFKK